MKLGASAILRIEVAHGLLVLGLLALLVPPRILEPGAFLIGAAFMGANFLLLGYGIRWLLSPFAAKGKVGLGVSLLVVKLALFLGLVSALFFRVQLHAPSFAVGVSSLLAAVLLERIWASQWETE